MTALTMPGTARRAVLQGTRGARVRVSAARGAAARDAAGRGSDGRGAAGLGSERRSTPARVAGLRGKVVPGSAARGNAARSGAGRGETAPGGHAGDAASRISGIRAIVRGVSAAEARPAGSVDSAAGAVLRLTRRGRFLLIGLPVVTGAAALLVVAAVFLLPPTVHASTDAVGAPVTHSVTVQSRQSLWEIAVAADPQRDPREVMRDIAELNGLTSPDLSAGQVLEVPSR